MSNDVDAVDHEKADELMGFALEYYMKRRDVVLKKLTHAQNATQRSIDELDASNDDSKPDAPPEKLREIHAYDKMWEQIIAMFKTAGMSDSDLTDVEETLSKIPNLIKRYYDLLVEQDKVLQALIQEIHSDEYKNALALVQKIQAKPDLMSGLDPQEFDLDEFREAFVIQVPQRNKR